MNQIPLFERELTDIIAWDKSQTISCEKFLHDVVTLASELPEHKYAINLCNGRYEFLVSFAAVLYRGQTSLLPSSQAIKEIQSIADEYADCYFIVSNKSAELTQPQLLMEIDYSAAVVSHSIPRINYSQLAAIVFTSGSSGKPTAHPKQWGDIISCAKLAAARFKLTTDYALISTVPSQHMYGLETTILFPLIAPVSIYNGQPFYPEDIRQATCLATKIAVLVTTPIHLRACIKANLQWQNISFIISAAATLLPEQAKEVEQIMQTSVYEIYGSTETGSMATRETVRHALWEPYPGNVFYKQDDRDYIRGSYLPEPVTLSDSLKIFDDGRVELLGRNSDMLKIAGKRAHIGDLNNKLLAINGVEAGVFFQPDTGGDDAKGVSRLIAFVVAPELEVKQITAELAKLIDPVFIPRPLYKVSVLPFTASGKLPRTVLQTLYNTLYKESACQ